MPLNNYGLIKARPIGLLRAGGESPHFQLKINDGGVTYRVAINARSQDMSEVMFLHKKNLQSPVFSDLAKLRNGLYWRWKRVRNIDISDLCIDYKRSEFIQSEEEFTPYPVNQDGENNDLNELFEAAFGRCIIDGKSTLYILGQIWGPDNTADKYFGFLPGLGIHDIHYNQGNPEESRWGDDNGVFQDGCIFMETKVRAGRSKWEGIFLKFQSQSWQTDDQTGHPSD